MVKINLRNITISIQVINPNKTEVIEIRNGNYKNNIYNYILITEKVLILEGDKVMVFPFYAVHLKIKTVLEEISSIIGDEVYISGISAIPEGKEREILNKLFTGLFPKNGP